MKCRLTEQRAPCVLRRRRTPENKLFHTKEHSVSVACEGLSLCSYINSVVFTINTIPISLHPRPPFGCSPIKTHNTVNLRGHGLDLPKKGSRKIKSTSTLGRLTQIRRGRSCVHITCIATTGETKKNFAATYNSQPAISICETDWLTREKALRTAKHRKRGFITIIQYTSRTCTKHLGVLLFHSGEHV